MGKVKRSSVWQYFIKDSRGGICKLCQRQVSCSGNTTNLSNHLKRYHKAIVENITNNRDIQQLQTTDNQFIEVLEEIPVEALSVSVIQRKMLFSCAFNWHAWSQN